MFFCKYRNQQFRWRYSLNSTNPAESNDYSSGTDTALIFGNQQLWRSETFIQEVPAMRIRPLHDRILIERVEEKEKTTGGIIIPDTAKEKPMQGKVIAVGKGKVTENGQVIAPDVKEGDRILFTKYAGTEVKIEQKEHLIIREDDVLGIIEE